ncbi:MAG: TRAP transporter substrate-binding protein DctP [Spirochaetota bacterium]
MKKKHVFCLLLALVFLFSAAALFAGGEKAEKEAAKPEKEYHWRWVSEEVEGDFMTVWAKKFAKEMNEWSGGKITIDVYPYGTLGAEKDINELCQNGTVEFVMSDYGWISGFVPQAQVLCLHYLWPKEKTPQVIEEVVLNGESYKMIGDAFRDKNFQMLGWLFEGWQWVTSNKPLRSLEDFKGLKMRVMMSKMLVESYRAYGASPTPMDYGEIYSGLQMGLIDAQCQPMFANYSMKFYEVQDHFTQLYADLFVAIPSANKQFFDSLPQNIQDKILSYWKENIIPAAEWGMQNDKEKRELIKEDRPSIEYYTYSQKELEPFEKRAKTVYPKYVDVGGEGAQEILDAFLADLEEAKEKFGVE